MALPTATAREQYDQRTLTVAADGTIDGKRVFKVEYPESFDAASNGDKDTVTSDVLSQTGINRWDVFPGESLCLCQTADVSNGGSQRIWIASYGYSSRFDSVAGEAGGAQAAELQADGLDTAAGGGAASSPAGGDKAQEAEARPYTIRTIKRTVQEVLAHDAETGREIKNYAGDYFDPPMMTERTYWGYEITFYKTRENLRWAAPPVNPPLGRPDYQDSVNDAVFKVFERPHEIGTLRVADVSTSMTWDKGAGGALVPVFEIRVELIHKPGGWKREVLNAGMREKISDTDPLKLILDGAGQPITEPVPLNVLGMKLTPGNTRVYITAWEYPKRNLIELFQ